MAEENKGASSQPPAVLVMGSKGNSIPWLITGALGIGLVVGGVVWYFTKSNKSESLEDYDISVEIVDPIVPRGGLAQINVTLINNSTETQNPILRMDMGGTGILESPIEGAPQAVGDILPGETITTTISYTLPPDWGPGKKLNAQLILVGISGTVWNASAAFVVQSDTGVLEIVSVTAINPSLVVGATQRAEIEVVLTNNTTSNLLRTFRMDLKGQNKLTWVDDGGDKQISLPSGETTIFTLSREVPTDWTENQNPIAVKIQNVGEGGAFWGDVDGSDEYRIFTLLNEGIALQHTENLIMIAKTPVSGLLTNGQVFSVTMNVTYKGGGAFLFGAGLKDGSENGVWATAEALLPSSPDWTTVSVTMHGIFYSSLGSGRTIDMLKAVQEIDGDLNINGEGMIKADWDADVFKVA